MSRRKVLGQPWSRFRNAAARYRKRIEARDRRIDRRMRQREQSAKIVAICLLLGLLIITASIIVGVATNGG